VRTRELTLVTHSQVVGEASLGVVGRTAIHASPAILVAVPGSVTFFSSKPVPSPRFGLYQ
jgi:hypothetical protein